MCSVSYSRSPLTDAREHSQTRMHSSRACADCTAQHCACHTVNVPVDCFGGITHRNAVRQVLTCIPSARTPEQKRIHTTAPRTDLCVLMPEKKHNRASYGFVLCSQKTTRESPDQGPKSGRKRRTKRVLTTQLTAQRQGTPLYREFSRSKCQLSFTGRMAEGQPLQAIRGKFVDRHPFCKGGFGPA